MQFSEKLQHLGRARRGVRVIVAEETIEKRQGHLQFAIGDFEDSIGGEQCTQSC